MPRPTAPRRRPPLAPEDRARLAEALQRSRVDARRSLFGPRSVTWRVNREAVLLLGGGRALLLQVAHPLVAAGVAAHSNFRRDPLHRLYRTLDLTLTITFADAAAAIAAVRTIERAHTPVRGRLPEPVGPFARGTLYDAGDPALLFWVHATLVDTALLVYERFVAPLNLEDRTRYYEESKIAARLFGIPETHIPRTAHDFDLYLDDMLHGETLAVGPASREIAAAILNPPLPFGLKQAAQTTNLFTVGLLPPLIRQRYGLAWGPAREALLRTVAVGTRPWLCWLPVRWRTFPRARQAA